MNGQNNQTPEAFIGSFGHPRKAELATMLLSGEATIESLAEAGFGRITVLEMARGIRNNVIDMKEFDFEWPRDVEVEVAPAPVRTAEVATEETVVTPEVTPEATVTPEVVPEATVVAPEAEVPAAEVTPEATVTPEPQG